MLLVFAVYPAYYAACDPVYPVIFLAVALYSVTLFYLSTCTVFFEPSKLRDILKTIP